MLEKSLKPRAERADGIRSRHAILDAAAKLATVEGLEGLSIGRLAEHIGMSKSGLYAHFRSKEELQLAAIEAAFGVFQEAIITPTLPIADPLQRVQALCNKFLDYLENRVFPGGCFFASVAMEFSSQPGPVRDSIAAIQNNWAASLVELCRQAQELGLMVTDEDPKQLAFEVNAFLLQANLYFTLQDDALAIRRGREAIRARLARVRVKG